MTRVIDCATPRIFAIVDAALPWRRIGLPALDNWRECFRVLLDVTRLVPEEHLSDLWPASLVAAERPLWRLPRAMHFALLASAVLDRQDGGPIANWEQAFLALHAARSFGPPYRIEAELWFATRPEEADRLKQSLRAVAEQSGSEPPGYVIRSEDELRFARELVIQARRQGIRTDAGAEPVALGRA